ncbi:hypothetical protein PYH37_004836 [Sinorhizobium numidicum]|uniref:DUF2157 domain-containing protein n=1 Tax=Sinorhizobium numidicum TaxID=680248 RepID=A0ABY8D211_9HYPH|nr:hypothetical protein [Sinorhizobium numidicum]WEX76525.1 hypothetical protein PYH37_004836 [Sinorhizobium numidicum]WEX83186.1 hypothetical protein PYH38_005548 [Sinorhizobium numidicum]
MTELNRALTAAAERGIISPDQINDLEAHLSDRGIGARVLKVARDASNGKPADAQAALESEQPRFLRGFHDILITIGVVVVLVGLWGIGGAIATLPLIVMLAEILVRRQRLALPAVALTLALVHWITLGMYGLINALQSASEPTTLVLIYVCAFPLPLGLFYWRYRIPLAFALLVLSIASVAIASIFTVIEKTWGIDAGLMAYPYLAPSILLVAAVAVFAIAMRYDIADPQRLSVRSDIAFWLHLAAAPALLYAMLSFVIVSGGDEAWWSGERGLGQAVAVVILVALFMTIGLVIDRRAFVTSGLLSLGAAIWAILNKSGASLDSYVFIVCAVVGLTVLVIGIFWQRLRRMAISLLPAAITTRLYAVP